MEKKENNYHAVIKRKREIFVPDQTLKDKSGAD